MLKNKGHRQNIKAYRHIRRTALITRDIAELTEANLHSLSVKRHLLCVVSVVTFGRSRTMLAITRNPTIAHIALSCAAGTLGIITVFSVELSFSRSMQSCGCS